MGVYIKDMEMPTAGMCKTITIFDDGAVVKGNGSEKLGIAVPVPPHGRLIDADADVYNYITTWHCNCSEFGSQTVMAVDDLQYLPVIIPAEEG